ncbi:hypothetical protein Gogos_005458 [Gossypium gossypioides]|uniref:Aspartic peptidase DDI1-type domain-containing protein n=1 Tax=Gossypium gossypioides TaxID=34282 RepID=A0A7J9D781_GOSGO|nr:hypothetical protein [Gossypium gossypioides]
MKKDYPKVSSVSAIKRNDELEEAKPIEKKTSRVNSMVLIPKKRNGGEGLIFVDINIAGQKRSVLVDTRASDLFISKKATRKLGLLIKKLNRKIKTVNSKEALTVGVVHNVELQIGEWKGKEEFEVIQLDDYDYVLRLNVLDRIQAALYPWADQIHIITSPLSKIIVLVHRDIKVEKKVLSSIQLVEDVSYGRNIDSIERNATKALWKWSLSKFISNEAEGLWAIRSQGVRIEAIQKGTSQNWGKLERRLLDNKMYQRM